MSNQNTGILYVVATPIGNLDDITLRAIAILKQVDRIVAEDTRHSSVLLKHFSIKKPLISMHNFNEEKQTTHIIKYLLDGENIALISDAGTPLISDPGFQLIRQAKAYHLAVVPIPGVSALIAALSVSGMSTDRFIFEGFLPAKTESCHNRLNILRDETRTLIFYEAPHRVLNTLKMMLSIFGENRIVVVARELTKKFETVLSDALPNIIKIMEEHPENQQGEIVILVAGSDDEREVREVVPNEVLSLLMAELPLKQAVNLASKITGERKNTLYERALLKKNEA